MQMEIGVKLGDGAGAEVYAWGTDRAIKLFRPGANWGAAQYEVRITRTAHASGAPAPEVYGIAEVDGRIGIIYPRYDGQSMLNLLFEGKVAPKEAGTVLAQIYYSLHTPGHKVPLWTFREKTMWSLERLAKDGAPVDFIESVRDVALSLPESGVLCHGDLHPGNVIMTEAGPKVIDWVDSIQANPMADVTRLHLTLSMFHIDGCNPSDDSPELKQIRREVDDTFMHTYAALASISVDRLMETIKPYMTVMAAMRMLESSSTTAEKEMFIDFAYKQAKRRQMLQQTKIG